jgi:hypothetical protein
MKRCIQLLMFLLLHNLLMAQGTNEISPNYLPFDEENWQLMSYDHNTGEALVHFSGNKPGFVAGKTVTTLANDTIGYFLRKIIAIEEQGSQLILQTRFADMTDVFINKSFTLSTATISPKTNGQLKSAQAISEAFTDALGVIHPCASIVHTKSPEGKKMAFTTNYAEAALLKSADESRLNIITIAEYLDDTDLYSSGDFRFFIEEGELSFKADAVFNFEFIGAAPQDSTQEIETSDLKKFQFYLEGEARAKTNLKMTFESAYSKEDEVEILEDVLSTTVKFLVGPVPVWISFGVDILAAYQFSAEAKVEADWGFDAKQNVRIGGEYLTESGELKPIAEKTFSLEFTPLTVQGEANMNARLEVFPRTSMMLYSAAGPYCDVVPYLSADFKAKAMASTSGETDLKWNSSLDWGVDFRAGLEPAFLKSILGEIGPVTSNLLQQNIWNAPASVGLAMTTGSNYILPVTIPLRFKISDSFRNQLPLAPLFFESSNGSLDKEWAISNSNGIATVNWTLNADNTNQGSETQSMVARLMNADDEVIDQLTVQVSVSNKTTAIFVEELSEKDSLVLNNVDILDMDKGIFGQNKNKAKLTARGLGMKSCGTGISGTYNEVLIEQDSYFDSCQNAIHLQGILNANNTVMIQKCLFNNIPNLAVQLHEFKNNHILESAFVHCENAIVSGGSHQASFELKNTDFHNCNQALNLNGFALGDIASCRMIRSNLDGISSIAIAANDLQQLFMQKVLIDNYHTGVYGKDFRGKSYLEKIDIINTRFGFDLNHFNKSELISSTVRIDHPIAASTGNKDFIGISINNSRNNYIGRNNLINLCTGISEVNCEANTFSENRITGSQCDSTGLHSVHSSPKIVNNTFDNNRGAALLLNNQSAPIIANNNFIANASAINNASSAVMVQAVGNYFEQLSGESISGQVVLVNNLSTKVSLVCDYPPDTLFIPSGSADSVALHVQNFDNLTDSVLVYISDERGWVSGNLFQTGTLSNNTGTIFYTPIYANPNKLKSAFEQTSEMIKASVVSAISGITVSDSIILSIYNQVLGSLYINPEIKTIMAGDSLKLTTLAYDQYGMEMDATILWSSSTGMISSDGWYFTNENDEGAALITASHPETGMQVSAQIWISSVQPVLSTLEIHPDTVTLTPLEGIRFNASGFDQFGFPYDIEPVWMASAGTIDRNGFYTAPDSTGTFMVEISNLNNEIVATAVVEVSCQENFSEQYVICGNDSLFIHSQWIKNAGIYYDTVNVSGACDQITTIEVVQAEYPEVELILSKNSFKTSDSPFTLTGGSPPGGIYTIDDEEIAVLDPSMFEPGSYQLHYRFENSDGCAASALATFTVELDVNVTELSNLLKVNIYPNPNNGKFTLEINSTIPHEGEIILSISSLLGQEIWLCRKQISKYVHETIELNHVQAGIYFLTIKNDHQKIVNKLIVH